MTHDCAVHHWLQRWKKLLKSVHICQSYPQNKTCTFFMVHGVQWCFNSLFRSSSTVRFLGVVHGGFWSSFTTLLFSKLLQLLSIVLFNLCFFFC